LIWRNTDHDDSTLADVAPVRAGPGREHHVTAMRGIGNHPYDPRDLIHEAFRIEGIATESCRAIFFDWAIGLDANIDVATAASMLHAELGPAHPDHPMTSLLAEAATGRTPGRGRRGRRRTRT
jgi:hypothetical protein